MKKSKNQENELKIFLKSPTLVFYTKTTDGDGIAALTINLPAGEYIITSMYNGLNVANKVTIIG